MSDMCQTDCQCGHAEHAHDRNGVCTVGQRFAAMPVCPCTVFTAATETGQGADDGCWHEWKPTLLPATHINVCVECGKYRDTAEEIRSQVLADAESAWEKWDEAQEATGWGSPRLSKSPFIAGYLAAKGLA